jgi:hypothetical protein
MPEPESRLTGSPDPEPRLAGGARPGRGTALSPAPGLATASARPAPSLADGAPPPLIRGYLDVLAVRLPASIAEEVADGLTATYEFCRSRGLAPPAAAEAAVAEFGPVEEIAAGFIPVNPARRAARRLLGIGPAVGACWVAALLTSRAGRSLTAWTAPGPAWVVTGLVLAGLIGLLAMAALGRRYRLAAATGVAGCLGYTAVDLALVITAAAVLAPVSWVTVMAMAASAARIAVTARLLHPALAR